MYETPFHPDSISTSSFLVTGGAGFVGSNIAEYLLRYKAKRVVVLDNLSTGFMENIQPFMDHPGFEFIRGDITIQQDCEKACRGIDYVFHDAALGSVPRSIENPMATHLSNETGFIQLLLAARSAHVKRVVYASSSSVYGDSQEIPKVEARIGKQLSPYAVSKRGNELYAEIFAKTYAMQIIGLRYFNIFGPRQNPNGAYAAAIPLFIKAFLNQQSPFINGDGNQTRDFTFVENAVQANIKAMLAPQQPAPGTVYNIAVGERVSLNELIHLLQKLMHSTIAPVYRAERSGDVRDSLADIRKAGKELGYRPQINMEEGLQRTLSWFGYKA